MNFKNLIFTTLLTTISSTLFAASLLDSVGVENEKGKKVIIHQLDAKDNYYSLGRRYGVHPSVIINFNKKAPLKKGQIIKIPTEIDFAAQVPPPKPNTQPAATSPNPPATETEIQQHSNEAPPATTPQETPAFIEYKVGSGETLFAIAKRFNTTVENIVQFNNLKNNSISPGQLLKIKSATQPTSNLPESSQTSVLAQDSTSPYNNSDTAARKLPNNRYGLYEKNEKGVAVWVDDANLDSSKKLVLHRFAIVGTVIKITNPMTNRTTFAKVVGRFTENESTKDVILVMTKDVAESLGALDKRFQVNISYGSVEE